MKTLLVQDLEGWFRVQIPDEAKCTFGPAVPFTPKQEPSVYDGGRARGYALRIYDGTKDNPLAVFTGVIQYRLDTIKVERRVLQEQGTTIWKSDEDGVKIETQTQRKSRMVDEAMLLEGTLPKVDL